MRGNADKTVDITEYNKKYDKPVLAFTDPHLPFQHKHYLRFLMDMDEKFGCDEQKMCMGDLVDNHAISRHKSSGDADGARYEYDRVKRELRPYIKAFPKVKICMGNHDAIPYRQAQELGLYHGFLKTFSEAWELPDTWEVAIKHIYKNVLYKHGMNCGGMNGARTTAIKEGMSVAMGHIHSHGGSHCAANETKLVFGLNAGCGIDVDAYAMEYGKDFKDKPTIGCGIVFSPTWAMFIPMDLAHYNEKYGK